MILSNPYYYAWSTQQIFQMGRLVTKFNLLGRFGDFQNLAKLVHYSYKEQLLY